MCQSVETFLWMEYNLDMNKANQQTNEPEVQQVKIPALTDEMRMLAVAEQVLNRHIRAFQMLADEGDDEYEV